MRSLPSREWQTHQGTLERTLGLKPLGIIWVSYQTMRGLLRDPATQTQGLFIFSTQWMNRNDILFVENLNISNKFVLLLNCKLHKDLFPTGPVPLVRSNEYAWVLSSVHSSTCTCFTMHSFIHQLSYCPIAALMKQWRPFSQLTLPFLRLTEAAHGKHWFKIEETTKKNSHLHWLPQI